MKTIKCFVIAFVLLIYTNAYTQFIQTIAGKTNVFANGGFGGDNTFARNNAAFNSIRSSAFDEFGNMYISDGSNQRIRKIDATTGVITTICGLSGSGGFNFDNILARNAKLNEPNGLIVDAANNIYIADSYNNRIRKIYKNTNGDLIITTIAGTGVYGGNGDNNAATSAELAHPQNLVFDKNNNLYINDRDNSRIRMISPSGTITTFAGDPTGNYFFFYPPSLAINASLGDIYAMAYDKNSHCLFFSSWWRIGKIDISTGIITNFAGNNLPGDNGYGDGGIALNARFRGIEGMICKNNKLYISDAYDGRIRVIDLITNLISTIAGGGTDNINEGISPLSASIVPFSVAINNCGNVVIPDRHRLREIFPVATGKIQHAKDYGTTNYTPIKNVDMGWFDYNNAYYKNSTTAPNQIIGGNNTGRHFLKSFYANVSYEYIVPNKNNDVNLTNGVNVNGTDVALINKHIGGTALLNNAFKCIAADVDNNGVINNNDVLWINKFRAGSAFNSTTTPKTWFPGNSVFPGGRLWAFAAKNPYMNGPCLYPFCNNIIGNNNPFYSNPNNFTNFKYPNCGGTIITDGYTSCNENGFDFYGVKLGDVDWDWNPLLAKGVKPIELFYEPINVTEIPNGHTITIPIRANNFTSVADMQFSFSFDPTHFEYSAVQDQNLEGIVYNEENATGENNKGVMSFVWTQADAEPLTLSDGTVLFNLVLTKKKAVKTDDFVLTSDLTRTEAINGDLELIPVTKKRCKIIDNREGAENNYKFDWDILPNYSKMGNLFIKAYAKDNKTVTVTVKNIKDDIVFSIERHVTAGSNYIFMNLRSKAVVPNGVYQVSVSGFDNEESKPFFVGDIDEYATDEEIASGDFSGVITNNLDFAKTTLEIQLYKKLKVSNNYADNGLLVNFMNERESSVYHKIYLIEKLITEEDFEYAQELVNNLGNDNEVIQNYKNYFSWILALSLHADESINTEYLEQLIVKCPLTAGFDVFSARDLYNCLADDNVQFGDVCPVNPNARSAKNNAYTQGKLQLKSINAVKENLGVKISVYPNPTKSNVTIFIPVEDKGVWKIDVQDIYGKLLSTRNTSALTKSLDLKVSEQRGIYFISFTNTQTNKCFVEKVVVE